MRCSLGPLCHDAHSLAAQACLVLALTAACATAGGGRSGDGHGSLDTRAISSELFARTNAARREAGVPELARSGSLMSAAQLQAEQMATTGRMSHDLPRAAYPTLKSRLALVSYAVRSAGENIATGQPDGASAIADWMASDRHRANILSGAYTELGTGVALAGDGRLYFAQVFGRPLRRATIARAGG